MIATDFEATDRQSASDYPVLRGMCEMATQTPYCEFDRAVLPAITAHPGPNAEALL